MTASYYLEAIMLIDVRKVPVIQFEDYGQAYRAMWELGGPPKLVLWWPLTSPKFWGELNRRMVDAPFRYRILGVGADLPYAQLLWLVREPERVVIRLGSMEYPTERALVDTIRLQKPERFELAWDAHYTLYWGAVRRELFHFGLHYEIVEVLDHVPGLKRRLVRRFHRQPDPDLLT